MTHQKLTPNRTKALVILKDLLCRLSSIHGDIMYSSLLEEGFTEEECGLLIGPSFRTAAAMGWMKKTHACLPSRRNHSNLLRIWQSQLHDNFSRGGATAAKEVREAYAKWEARGLTPPDDLANMSQDR